MTSKNLVAAVLVTVALVIAGCSKTQDTAPETRVFGNPPVIESVTFVVEQNSPLICDITDIVTITFCTGNLPNMETDGPVLITGTYTELRMQARVVDPESTSTQTDILLMGASFIPVNDDPVVDENTLVMLDDGSTGKFPIPQTADFLFGGPLDCKVDEMTNECSCNGARYDLDSNDAVSNDQMFTRNLAFMSAGTGGTGDLEGEMFRNCIMRERHQFPAFANAGSTFQFSFDAVDRRGNITRWPERPIATISPTTATCSGDPCACCTFGFDVPQGGCSGLSGLRSPDFPNGFCNQ